MDSLPSPYFSYRDRSLYCEGVSLTDLARQFGTPLYVYSQRTIEEAAAQYEKLLAQLNTSCAMPLKPIQIWQF